MSDLLDDARQIIESRLAEIREEAGRLEHAIAELQGGGERPGRGGRRKPPARSNRTRPRPERSARPRSKAAKRAPRGARREELLSAIRSSPGARPSELTRTIGIRPTQVSVLIAKARAEGLVVKRGEGYTLKK